MEKMKHLLRLMLVLAVCVVATGCGDDEEDLGFVPDNLVGKTLVLNKSFTEKLLSAYHEDSESVVVESSNLIDYVKYPPSYSYSRIDKNFASYRLTVTKKTWNNYYGNYTYSRFVFDVKLHFTTETSGAYSGKQINGKNKETAISGSFRIE